MDKIKRRRPDKFLPPLYTILFAFYRPMVILSIIIIFKSCSNILSRLVAVALKIDIMSTYYQQMLGAAIVHPNFKEVIPLAPEFIIKQDGKVKTIVSAMLRNVSSGS